MAPVLIPETETAVQQRKPIHFFFFHKCDKNEKLGEFFYATKEQIQVLLRTLSQDLAVQ
jgi:hypothetical protein